MRIGIVGSEGAKFTPGGESSARALIRSLIQPGDLVVSGGCHLGGIDVWAVEEARIVGCHIMECKPETLAWWAYKARNIQIAENSEHVICITVNRLPPSYKGMTFPRCYHCHSSTHIKSGGCWTTKYARRIGIPGETMVITQ